MTYRVTYNGMEVEYLKSENEVHEYIGNKLDSYMHLNPKKIHDNTQDNKRIIVWQYNTLYSEMFMVEKI